MDYFPETVGNGIIIPTGELIFFSEGLKPPTRYVMVCWCWPVLGQTEMGMGWVSSTPQNWAKIAHDYSAIFWVSLGCSQGTGGFDSSAQWLTDPLVFCGCLIIGKGWIRLIRLFANTVPSSGLYVIVSTFSRFTTRICQLLSKNFPMIFWCCRTDSKLSTYGSFNVRNTAKRIVVPSAFFWSIPTCWCLPWSVARWIGGMNTNQAFYDEKYDPENGNYLVGLQFHPEAWACHMRWSGTRAEGLWTLWDLLTID